MSMESKSKFIFCCGARRSGSTLQYNIVADIVENTNSGIRIEFVSPADFPLIKEKYKEVAGYKVFKTHFLTEEIKHEIEVEGALAFYTYRDVRDVIVSLINKEWAKKEKKSIKDATIKYLNDYYSWMNIENNLVLRKYEEFYLKINKECDFIANVLKLKLDEDVKQMIVDKLSLNNLKEKLQQRDVDVVEYNGNHFDKKTLLHINHINNGDANQFLDFLNIDEILEIEAIATNWLCNNGYNLVWAKKPSFISYSQHYDDYISWVLLNRKTCGLVIEIGAFDGVHLSNSYSLEKIGWKSLCIEPNPNFFKYLVLNRPLAKNINAAIVNSEHETHVEFYAETIGVLSGCSFDEEDIKARYSRRGLTFKPPQKFSVDAKTLDNVLKNYQFEMDMEIDVVSIDVEGFELNVLQGFDIKKFNPKLFVIEANDLDSEKKIVDYFSDFQDYFMLLKNHQNLFFLHKSVNYKLNFNFDEVKQAYQFHPLGPNYSIQSVPAKVIYTNKSKAAFLSTIINKLLKK